MCAVPSQGVYADATLRHKDSTKLLRVRGFFVGERQRPEKVCLKRRRGLL